MAVDRMAWSTVAALRRRISARNSVCAGALALVFVAEISAAARQEQKLPERFYRAPYALMSLTVGYPNDGWQLRAKKLRDLPYLKIKGNSRDNCYGHPALVLMLKRSAREVARSAPGAIMVVGDLSRK